MDTSILYTIYRFYIIYINTENRSMNNYVEQSTQTNSYVQIMIYDTQRKRNELGVVTILLHDQTKEFEREVFILHDKQIYSPLGKLYAWLFSTSIPFFYQNFQFQFTSWSYFSAFISVYYLIREFL